MELIYAIVIGVVSAISSLFLLSTYLKRTIPSYLENVTNSFSEALSETFKTGVTDPTVKRAMSILGKQSGEVRHNKAAENALAEGILQNVSPEIQMILDRVAPNFIEEYGADTALMLANKYAPLIRQFLGVRSNTVNQGETQKYGKY